MRVFKSVVKYGFVISALFVIGACSTPADEKKVVAEVGDRKLYESDLAEVLPDDLGEEDSMLLAGEYIEKWVKQELLIQKADENLTAEQKDVSKELRDYRNSLIIYKYKNELIRQRMDTVVTAAEVEEYYRTHATDFNLNRNIVKAVFVQIPKELANQALLKELISDTSEDGLNELREYCLQYAKRFDIFIDNWVDFRIIARNMPEEIADPESFLTRNKTIEMNDANYYYIAGIHEYKLRNEPAPLEFVENNIKNLILNQRKITFLKEIEENVYSEGIRQNKFRIYNGENR